MLDPTYGEYLHILRQVIGCEVDQFPLHRGGIAAFDMQRLAESLQREYNLIVLVDPNSPTGQHIRREPLESVLITAPESTRIWVDETYLNYIKTEQSLETFRDPHAQCDRLQIHVKSLCLERSTRGLPVCAAHQLEALRGITPPWAVSLPAQVAAVNALNDPDYYTGRYGETHQLRKALARELARLGWDVLPGCANFVLARLLYRWTYGSHVG